MYSFCETCISHCVSKCEYIGILTNVQIITRQENDQFFLRDKLKIIVVDSKWELPLQIAVESQRPGLRSQPVRNMN